MDTSLTVARAYSMYSWMLPSLPRFLEAVNRHCERMMMSNLWEGVLATVDFGTTSDTRLVLPRPYISVVGYNRQCVARPVFGTFLEYQEMGIGHVNPDVQCMEGLIDDHRVCTQKQLTGTCTLRVKPSNAIDAGKVARFYGKDQDGKVITTTGVEGVNLAMAVPSSDTIQQFTELAAISLPVSMIGGWTLWQVIAGAETQIGSYEPGEDTPNYRVYKVGKRFETDAIRCYCRRGFVPVTVLTDFIWPGNLNALRFGIKACQYEDSGKNDLADGAWARAEQLLDQEVGAMRGSEIPTLRLEGMALPRTQEFVN